MPDDGGVHVADERVFSVTEVHTCSLPLPIATESPAWSLVCVVILSPSLQFVRHQVIHRAEGTFGDTRAVVLSPASDDGVERCNESSLWCPPMLAYHPPYLVLVSVDGFLTWLDDSFEARFASIGAGAVLGHPELPNIETQEVKAYVPLMFIKGAGDPGLAGFQAQP